MKKEQLQRKKQRFLEKNLLKIILCSSSALFCVVLSLFSLPYGKQDFQTTSGIITDISVDKYASVGSTWKITFFINDRQFSYSTSDRSREPDLQMIQKWETKKEIVTVTFIEKPDILMDIASPTHSNKIHVRGLATAEETIYTSSEYNGFCAIRFLFLNVIASLVIFFSVWVLKEKWKKA